MLHKIDMGIEHIEKVLIALSWVVSLFVTLMIVVDVFLRFVFNHPLPASWEVSEICMPMIVFFAFAYTLRIDGHVRVSLVKDRVPRRVRLGFDLFAQTISFLTCAILTYYSWIRFWESFKMNEEILAAIRLPWWVGKGAMPIGFGLFAVGYLLQMLFNLTGHNRFQKHES